MCIYTNIVVPTLLYPFNLENVDDLANGRVTLMYEYAPFPTQRTSKRNSKTSTRKITSIAQLPRSSRSL